MSYDLVVVTRTDLDPSSLVLAADEAGDGQQGLTLGTDEGHRMVIIADATDRPIAYLGPTLPVHDPEQAGRRLGLGEVDPTELFWTELGTLQGQDLPYLGRLARRIAQLGQGRVLTPDGSDDDDRPSTTQADRGAAEGLDGHEAPAGAAAAPFDLVGEEECVVVWRRPVVFFGPWLGHLLLEAERRGLRPVLLSPPHTRLTPAVERMVRQGAVRWVVDDGDRSIEPRRGVYVDWDGAGFAPTAPAPATLPSPDDSAWVLHVEVEGLHPYADPLVGRLLEAAAEALDAGPLDRVGLREPTEAPWDRTVAQEAARLSSPAPVSLVVGGRGLDGSLTSVPQPPGVMESVEVLADAAVEPLTEEQLVEVGTALAAAGAQRVVLGYRWSTADRLVGAGGLGPVVPALLVIDTGRFDIDLDTLDQASGGRARTARGHLLVVFPPPPPDVTQEVAQEVWESWAGVLRLLMDHDQVAQLASRDRAEKT